MNTKNRIAIISAKSPPQESLTQLQPLARFGGCLTVLFLLLQALTGWAQSGTWTNLAGGSWTNTANWSDSVIADGTDSTADFGTLDLAAGATVTLDGARTIGNLVFSDTTATYFNWALNTGSAGPLTLAVSSGQPTITVNNGAATLGVVVAGTGGFVKSGAGALTLSSANTYAGNTTNTAGTLTLGNINALGTSTLVLVNNALLGCSANLSAGVTNAVVLAGNGTISASGNQLKMSGAISGPGALTTAGTSILTLAAVNTYSGATTNTAAALTLNGPGVSLPGDLYINGGVVQLGAAGQIADTAIMTFGTVGTLKFWLNGFNETIGGLQDSGGANVRLVVPADTGVASKPATLTLDVSGANAYNFSGYLASGVVAGDTSPLSITKNGTGSQTFSGVPALVTYTGPTVINAGVLEFSGASSVGNNSAITLAGGSVKFSGGGARSGLISGTGNLIKAGAAALTLSGNNSYAGYTTNTAGTLGLGHTNALGTSTLVLGGNTALAPTVQMYAGTGVTNAIQLAGDSTIAQGNLSLTLAGEINGSGALTKSGGGWLQLLGNNTYTGSTTISNGLILVNGSIGTNAVAVRSGAMLGGTGTLGGSVTFDAGSLAMLFIGSPLTISGALTANTNEVQVNLTNAVPVGSYLLATCASSAGTFSNTPTIVSGSLIPDTHAVVVTSSSNVVLQVVANLATTPTNIVFNVSGTNLSLTWPGSHLGWYAQSNSVDIADTNYWVNIPGSTLVTNLDITMDPALTNVFYRLKMP